MPAKSRKPMTVNKLEHDELKQIEDKLCEAIQIYNDVRETIVGLKKRRAAVMKDPPSYVMFPHEPAKTRT